MKKLIASGGLAMVVMPFMPLAAENLSLTATGVYQLSDFDSINSSYEMAEQKAVDEMASQVSQKVMSVKKLDKNGYYSRASWLINTAVVNKKRISQKIGECESGTGMCATVQVTAVFDSSHATGELKKIYSDASLAEMIDKVIKEETVKERIVLAGGSIDYADAKQRQAKRKKILDYISTKANKKTVAAIGSSALAEIKQSGMEHHKKELSKEALLLEYQDLLNGIKSDLEVELLKTKGYTLSDGTQGVGFRVKVKSAQLEKALEFVTEALGVPGGKWSKYHNTKHPDHFNESWAYVTKVHPYEQYTEHSSDAVIIGLEDEGHGSPVKYFVQHGSIGKYRGAYSDRSDHRLSYKQFFLIEELSKSKVCVEFSVGELDPVEKCLTGSGEKTNASKASDWNKSRPYLWFLKNETSLGFTIDLSEELKNDSAAMQNASLQYNVVVKN